MTAAVDRLAGWRAALGSAGLPDDAIAYGDFAAAGGAAAMEELLDRHPDTDAVFAASDLMAEGALRVLRARGKSVPGDVAVVGFDNLGVAATTSPALTTVQNPVVEMVKVATGLLLDLIAGEPVAKAPGVLARADHRRVGLTKVAEGDGPGRRG
ncbi:substrate-binding domain-containing protein [Oerskovia sp. M15]